MERRSLLVNQREYAWPEAPVVVVCIDGSEPDYMDRAIADGRMPWLAKTRPAGTDRVADCVVPTFTNPNNLSIVTGQPPSVHGIAGNFFWNPDTGEEVMMNFQGCQFERPHPPKSNVSFECSIGLHNHQ